jgi:hypothetical protein
MLCVMGATDENLATSRPPRIAPMKSRWVLVFLAAAGAASGQLVNAARARACSCAPEAWSVELSSTTSSDTSVDHREYWPKTALLTSYPGHAHVWMRSNGDAGTVERAGAGR